MNFVRSRFTRFARLGLHCGAFLCALLQARGTADYATPYSFTTLAGLSSIGSDDGPDTVARFNWPASLALDAAGNLYVADHDNHTIRKITPAGVVSTLAGTPGLRGCADGTGADALFINPDGLAVDAAGNVYVADKINSTIRKITPAGVVSTLAGTAGATGFTDGTGAAARFNIPTGIAVDAAGNLYVADQLNNAIRRISPAGVVTTLAGKGHPYGANDGTVDTAGFFYPWKLAVDTAGNLYVSEAGNNAVRKITAAGVVSTLAGGASQFGSADGPGTTARFRGVADLAVDAAGNVFVADAGNHTIRRIAPDGAVTTVAGAAQQAGSADGPAATARFNRPVGIALDRNGNLYVADSNNNSIRRISAAGDVTTLAGLPLDRSVGSTDGIADAALFNRLAQAAVGPAGEVYVADTINATVRRISPDGTVTTFAGRPGVHGDIDGDSAHALLDSPLGIAVNAAGTVYVTDAAGNTIRQITPQGVVTTLAGDPLAPPGSTDGTGSAGRFNFPAGIALDAAGQLYVADRGNYTVRKISPTGTVTTLAGRAGASGRVDGIGATAQFEAPEGIAADTAGNVYVANAVRHGSIRRIAPDGSVTTLAGGAGGDDNSTDGIGLAARFNLPQALTVDLAGNVYVTDGENHTIRRITPAGAVTTLAGLASAPGNADGTGRKTRFLRPNGIGTDRQGVLFVTSGTTVRKGRLATAPVITRQPADQSVTAGSSVQFSVAADGTPTPTYQWYRGTTAVSGATAASLSLASAQAADAGDYTVVATNDLGRVTSSKATLTVTAAPITPPPASGGGGGGSGGGGAPSTWFIVALLTLSLVRRRQAGRTAPA